MSTLAIVLISLGIALIGAAVSLAIWGAGKVIAGIIWAVSGVLMALIWLLGLLIRGLRAGSRNTVDAIRDRRFAASTSRRE